MSHKKDRQKIYIRVSAGDLAPHVLQSAFNRNNVALERFDLNLGLIQSKIQFITIESSVGRIMCPRKICVGKVMRRLK